MNRIVLAIISCVCLATASVATVDYVWFEAEDYDKSNWPSGTSGEGPFAAKDDSSKRLLSNGVWLNANPAITNLFLTKEITIPVDGEYIFYARCFGNWGGGTRSAFRWRLDDGVWTSYSRKEGDTIEFVKPTKVSTLSWIRFNEKVKLSKGKHLFRIEVLPPHDAKGFDCFVFSTSGFVPNGTLKPGTKLGLVDPGMWVFEPDRDSFSSDAMLDLRSLNEKESGQDGWVHLSDDGEQFCLGSGKTVRFWSVETTASVDMEETRHHMRFLAKRGVNAVRVFQTIAPMGGNLALSDINEKHRDQLWQVVAAARENGIYVLWTPLYYKTWAIKKTWNIPDYQKWNNHREPRHALFTNKEVQDAYRIWMQKVLLEKNPYTGKPMVDDPTLYCIQLQNEDSIFWSGLNWGLTDEGVRTMCKRFGDWLGMKYGSPEKALTAWGSKNSTNSAPGFNEDNLAKGEVGLPKSAYFLSGRWLNGMVKKKGNEPVIRRCRDSLIFIAEFQRKFNNDTRDYLQKKLGYKGMISANNWKSADTITLDDVERYTYDGCEIIATHKYVGVHHVNPTEGRRGSYQINKGDLYIDDMALRNPSLLPHNFKMVSGHAGVITESTWVPPRGYHAEGPLLVAAYSALTGLDCYNWFAFSEHEWPKMQGKWSSDIPGIQSGFPAAALLYRRGDVKEPKAIVSEKRSLDDLWDRKKPQIAEANTYDPNVNSEFAVGATTFDGGIDPMAFHVGPVRVSYGGTVTNNYILNNLSEYINHDQKWVKSITGELLLEYGKGLFTCDTALSQAATGLFKDNGGIVKLSDVTISSQDHYGCVIVTSLDNVPLSSSGKVLVQVTAKSRPYGWKEESGIFSYTHRKKEVTMDGLKILSIGTMPWNMQETDISISIQNSKLKKATLLDANGMAVKKLNCKRNGKTLEVNLPKNALYVILH